MSQFAVVQGRYEFTDWEMVAQILTEVLGMHPTMAKQRARRPRGFLAEKLDGDMALRLHRVCRRSGLVTYVVREGDVVTLPKPVRIHALWIADDALWYRRGPTGRKSSLAWDGIVLMAAYEMVRKESFYRWSAQYSSAGHNSELHADEYWKDYKEYVADVVGLGAGGGMVRLRLESRGLNYQEALGADAPDILHRKNAQDDGFRLVLARIHGHSPKVSVPPETLVVLGGTVEAKERLYELPRIEEFEAYNRWLLQMMRLASQAAARRASQRGRPKK